MTTADPPVAPAALAGCEVCRPDTLADALRTLNELGAAGAPLAGGTWVMRSPLRGDPVARVYVSIAGVPELGGIDATGDAVSIGASVTHAELAAFDGPPALAGLVTAAARSAFPAVRSVATVGGNLAAIGFPEADLVPALLALDARIQLATPDGGSATEDLASYLETRAARPDGELITRVVVPVPAGTRSAFERLTIRGGGEYAVANVAVSVALDGDAATHVRVAVGSVEQQARLCPESAAVLVGSPLDAQTAERAGRAAAEECTGRDGLDAPGWYRLTVLPALMRDAVAGLNEKES